jgi:hypothetical protein
MARRNRHHSNRQKPHLRAARETTAKVATAPVEKKPPVVYGKPFIVLEDVHKSTFVYKGGQWVGHSATIAECRQDCQVKELPQKINGMTRYEICAPVLGIA